MASSNEESSIVSCSKTKLCDQNKGHPGTCSKKGQPRLPPKRFWEDSPYFKLREEQGELTRKSSEVNAKEAEVEISQENLAKQRDELDLHETSVQERVDAANHDLNASIERREEVDGEVAEIEQHLQNISQEYVTNLKAHTDIAHCSQTLATESTRPSHSLTEIRLKSMSVTELKAALREKGLSTSGKKEILVRRLESILPNAK